MNTHLTNPLQPPTATALDDQRIDRIANAFSKALDAATAEQPTAVRVNDPSIPSYKDGTRIGDTPPVPQPGRPAMSTTASDISGVMIASGVPIFALGAAATGVLWGSGHADPTVIAWICASVVALPAVIAVPVLAVKGLMKSAKEVVQAAPPVIHQHYSGPVHQRNIESNSRGIWVKNTNELPR